MEKIAFEPSVDIYNQYDFITDGDFMNNRLFATFTQQDSIDDLVNNLANSYEIMYNTNILLYIIS